MALPVKTRPAATPRPMLRLRSDIVELLDGNDDDDDDAVGCRFAGVVIFEVVVLAGVVNELGGLEVVLVFAGIDVVDRALEEELTVLSTVLDEYELAYVLEGQEAIIEALPRKICGVLSL